MEPVVFAAERFGLYTPSFEELTDGLIHKTYKVTTPDRAVILQQVNVHVFKKPEQVIDNYKCITQYLSNTTTKLPALLQTRYREDFWIDTHGFCWRAFEYIANTYTECLPASAEKIHSAAQCYGRFTHSLAGLDMHLLQPAITGFHNLRYRYDQFQQAVATASAERLRASEALLVKVEQRKSLVDFYDQVEHDPQFVLRAMHHDTKLSNILFDKITGQAVCPIDLDTTMPGYFFSDLGDMIRSMVSAHDEHAPADLVSVDPEIYNAIVSGYQNGMDNSFTQTENDHIHESGRIMLYMQAIRFLTDYLMNDVYYKITYPEQNFNRALNQLTLLEKLEHFLREVYGYNTIR